MLLWPMGHSCRRPETPQAASVLFGRTVSFHATYDRPVHRYLKFSTLIAVLALVASACGGSSLDLANIADGSTTSAPPTTVSASATSVAPTTTAAWTTTTVAAVESTTTAPTTTSAAPVVPDLQIPTLVLADGNTVRSVGPGPDGTMISYVEVVTDNQVSRAFLMSDFTAVTEEHFVGDPFGAGEVVLYRQDGSREVIPGVDRLFGVEMINGEESVIAAEDSFAMPETGDILAIGLETLTVVHLGLAWAPEYGAGTVEWSNFGTAVVSGWSDLTETVSYVDSFGAEVILPSPTDDLAYASPPMVQAAALSPDGKTVVWAEGPDQGYDDATGDFMLVGDSWVVKGMDLATGRVEFAMPIDFTGVAPTDSVIPSIRYSPTHLVVNRMQITGGNAINLAPVMIDITGAEPATVPFDVVGNASLFPAPPSP